MSNVETQGKLRRAAEHLAVAGNQPSDASLLLDAWEHIKGLHLDDLPSEMQPAYGFLQREIERAKGEELTPREVVFLAEKIRKLELMWLENSHKSLDRPA
jgi:hypothetical protein